MAADQVLHSCGPVSTCKSVAQDVSQELRQNNTTNRALIRSGTSQRVPQRSNRITTIAQNHQQPIFLPLSPVQTWPGQLS